MGRPCKFAQVDRVTIERALASGQGVLAAADVLGMSGNHLYLLMRRFGVAPPPRQAQRARPRPPAELHHPPVAALLHRLNALRAQAQLICRIYLPGPGRAAMLRQLEVQQRELRAAVRGLLGDGEARQGIVRRPFAPGTMRPAWDVRAFEW